MKGPNLISSKGGWKPRMCRASSWEMGGRLAMQINTWLKFPCWWLVYVFVYSLLTFLRPECCTGNSNRTLMKRFHTKSCTVVGWCSTWRRKQTSGCTIPHYKPSNSDHVMELSFRSFIVSQRNLKTLPSPEVKHFPLSDVFQGGMRGDILQISDGSFQRFHLLACTFLYIAWNVIWKEPVWQWT